jgi:hypothetical protein
VPNARSVVEYARIIAPRRRHRRVEEGGSGLAGQIFISYRTRYGDRVDRIVDALVDAGYEEFELFRDVDDIEGGENWTPQLERAMQQARLVLAVVGPGWASDRHVDWVRSELETALENEIRIVLALLPDGRQELGKVDMSLQPALAGQAVTLSDELPPADVDALVRALRRGGVHPSAASDHWTEMLVGDDIGYSPSELRSTVSATVRSWQEEASRPVPPIVVLDGPPGSGRSATLRAGLRGTSIDDSVAPVSLHTTSAGHRRRQPAALVETWIADIVRWSHANAAPEVQEGIAAALVEAVRSGLSGQRLPSDIVGLLPIGARTAWIAATGDRSVHRDRQLVTAALAMLHRLAETIPLVLAVDDCHRLDATSLEVVRQMAERLAEEPERRVLLVLCSPPAELLADLPDGQIRRIEVGTSDLLMQVLDRCDIDDAVVRNAIVEAGIRTPVSAVAYLHHLRLRGALRRDADGAWRAEEPAGGWPTLDAALDAAIDRFVLPTWQRVVGIGALLGQVFPLAAALEAANRSAPTAEDVITCWDELRAGDPDEVVIRCIESDGRRMVAFGTSTWSARFRRRMLSAERDVPFGALAAVVESGAADNYDEWLLAAELHTKAKDPGAAGDAYLRAARCARLGLSDESAARAYALAAGQLWEATQSGDPAQTVRQLTRIAYCYYRAANLLAIASDDAGAYTTSERLRLAGEARLEDALHTLEAADTVMAEWRRHPSELPDLDLLVMNEVDVQSEDDVRVDVMLHTLSGYANLQRGRNLLAISPPECRRAEHFLLQALRHADQGLDGILRLQLVVRASAGMARALIPRVAAATGATERRHAARGSFLHGARSLMVREIVGARADDRQARRALDESVRYVLLSRASLAEQLELPNLGAHVRHRQEPGRAAADPVGLVLDVAHLTSAPHRLELAERTRERADELLGAYRTPGEFDVDAAVADDVTIVAFAQHMLRDVEGRRLLAIGRDVGLRIDGRAWNRAELLHGDVAALVLDRDLGLGDALGDRFRRIRFGVGSYVLDPDEGSSSRDALFGQVMHLAGIRAAADRLDANDELDLEDFPPRVAIERWWKQAIEDGDVLGAYAAVRRWRTDQPMR